MKVVKVKVKAQTALIEEALSSKLLEEESYSKYKSCREDFMTVFLKTSLFPSCFVDNIV